MLLCVVFVCVISYITRIFQDNMFYLLFCKTCLNMVCTSFIAVVCMCVLLSSVFVCCCRLYVCVVVVCICVLLSSVCVWCCVCVCVLVLIIFLLRPSMCQSEPQAAKCTEIYSCSVTERRHLKQSD